MMRARFDTIPDLDDTAPTLRMRRRAPVRLADLGIGVLFAVLSGWYAFLGDIGVASVHAAIGSIWFVPALRAWIKGLP